MDDGYEIDLTELIAALAGSNDTDPNEIEIGPLVRQRYLETLGRCIENNLFNWYLDEAGSDVLSLDIAVPHGEDYNLKLEIMDTHTMAGLLSALGNLKRLNDLFSPEGYRKKFENQEQAEENIDHIKSEFAELEEWLVFKSEEELHDAFLEQDLPPIL